MTLLSLNDLNLARLDLLSLNLLYAKKISILWSLFVHMVDIGIPHEIFYTERETNRVWIEPKSILIELILSQAVKNVCTFFPVLNLLLTKSGGKFCLKSQRKLFRGLKLLKFKINLIGSAYGAVDDQRNKMKILKEESFNNRPRFYPKKV